MHATKKLSCESLWNWLLLLCFCLWTFWTNVKQGTNEHNTSIIEYSQTPLTQKQNTYWLPIFISLSFHCLLLSYLQADAYHSHERKMREILLKCQSNKNRKINLEKIRPGLSVAVKVKFQVYRGLVISFESESSLVRVKLVDTGRVADVQLNDVTVMPNALRETNQVQSNSRLDRFNIFKNLKIV